MITCNFYNDGCAQKSVHGQIIEGFLDGEVVKHLLQKNKISL